MSTNIGNRIARLESRRIGQTVEYARIPRERIGREEWMRRHNPTFSVVGRTDQ